MTLNFPINPSSGQAYTGTNGLSYVFDGVKWTTTGTYTGNVVDILRIDDISASFNGVKTTFDLKNGGNSLAVSSPQAILISLGGIVQEPTSAYTVDATNKTITFTEAPTTNLDFWGILYSRIPQQTAIGQASSIVDDGVDSGAIAPNAVNNVHVNSSAAITSDKIQYTGTYTGAVARTLKSALNERVSVKDFGAVGDGTTDDLAAFNLAKTYIQDDSTESIRELYIPPGKYHLSDIWFPPFHDGYKQMHIIGHGAVLDNSVVVNNAVCLHGLTVDGSPDASFVFLRGQFGYHEMLSARSSYYGYYFGVASRQTLTVASVSGFAVGDKITANPDNNNTSEGIGYINKIDASAKKLYLVKCFGTRQAGFFRERVARYTQDNGTGDGTGSAGTVALITYASHGLSNGNTVELKFRSGSSGDDAANGTYTVSSVTTDTFKITSSQSRLIQGSYDTDDNGSYVRIVKDEQIIGDGAGGGTASQTTTVTAVECPYGTNSQVTRCTFNNCGAYDMDNAGWYVDGTTTGTNRSWFNAITTVGLALVSCDGKAYKVRGYLGGNGGGSQANYNTHLGMNIESGASNESVYDITGRQNTFIGGHFVKTNGDGESVNITDSFNYLFGGRYVGTVNVNSNAEIFHASDMGGSQARLTSAENIETSALQLTGTTYSNHGWSPLPASYITSDTGDTGYIKNHEIIIDMSQHPSFVLGTGHDVSGDPDNYSSFINDYIVFRITVHGQRNASGHADKHMILNGILIASQENNDKDGYDADWMTTASLRVEAGGSGTPTDPTAGITRHEWDATNRQAALQADGGTKFLVDTAEVNKVLTIATSDVNTSTEVITENNHLLETGVPIVYSNGGGTTLAGLTHDTTYYAIRVDDNDFKVATSEANATAGTAINLTGTGNNSQTFTRSKSGISELDHGFTTGTPFVYNNGGGTTIPGLANDKKYYAIKVSDNDFQLATSLANANAGTAYTLTGTGNNSQYFHRCGGGAGLVYLTWGTTEAIAHQYIEIEYVTRDNTNWSNSN